MEQKDETNFTSSSSHRLPTISASQALHKLSSSPDQWVSTGLSQLDAALRGTTSSAPDSAQECLSGGFRRGQVTEIYGPPGAGKTALSLQAAACALRAGDSVVWIDTAHELSGSRLADVLHSFQPSENTELHSSPPLIRSAIELSESFHHFWTPTLPHLIALLCHPSPNFPPHSTSLIVVNTISTLLGVATPRASKGNDAQQTPGKKNDAVQWAANRRWSAIGEFATKLGRLAALKDLAVVVSSQTTTKVKMEQGAVLRPSIMSRAWLEAINTRIVVFRDFLPPGHESQCQGTGSGVRFAGLVKIGTVTYDRLEKAVPFKIAKSGIHEIAITPSPPQQLALPLHTSLPLLKRKREAIADSESEGEELGSEEELGWIEEDPLTLEETLAESMSDMQGPEVTISQDEEIVVDHTDGVSAGVVL